MRALIVVTVMLGVLAADAARAAPAAPRVVRASPSSAKAILAPTDAPDASLLVVFMSGAADDLLEEGLTRLSQYTMLHGQDKAPFAALDEALYGAGATIEVNTSVRECSFQLTAPRGSFDAIAARMLKQLLGASSGGVSNSGVERARRMALTDVLQVGSDKWIEANVAASVLITESIEGGGDYNNPIWGDPDTLSRIPAANVGKYLRERLTPANAVVVAAGGFDDKKLAAEIARYKSAKGVTERALRRPELKNVLPLERRINAPREVHIQLQVVDVTDARSAALMRTLAAYVHDRLFWRLRKSGHVYSPYVDLKLEEWLDFLIVFFTVTEGATIDLAQVMVDELDATAAGGIDADSLQRARAIADARLRGEEQDPALYARALVPLGRGVTSTGPEVRAALATVDDKALREAAAQVLSRSRAVTFTFGRSAAVGKPRGGTP